MLSPRLKHEVPSECPNNHERKSYMTIQEMLASEAEVLPPTDVAEVLKCDPQYVRLTARDRPEALGFPVIVVGKRVKIPRMPFLRRMGYLTGEGSG